MLQFEGNTAAFVCYAYVRVQSIKRKTSIDINQLLVSNHAKINLQTSEEIDLGLQLLRFPEIINNFTVELLPNRITDYL